MPYARPTLTQLRQQTAGDINAALPGSDALLRYSNLGILSEVMAGLASGHYGYLDWLAQQMVPFTATGEYLEGWAALKGVVRKGATAASGQATFQGTAGAVLAKGTAVSRSDRALFVVSADAAVVGGAATAQLQAVTPGIDGNGLPGLTMTLVTGVTGIAATGAASTAFIGGAEAESDDDLRARMLVAYRTQPQGGARDDYVRWALQVPGVTRAWCVPGGMGAGSVVVLFMMDGVRSGADGFPQGASGVAADEPRGIAATGDQLTVANALSPLRPATAIVYAAAPGANVIGLTIVGLTGASADTRTAISKAVKDALFVGSQPGGITNLSAIETAIAGVPGTAGFVITGVTATAGTVTPGTTGNVQSNAGALPKLGVITYA